MQREKMTTTEAILCGTEGVCTLQELANELDMRKSMLMARIEFMARADYLCEVSLGKCKGRYVEVDTHVKEIIEQYVPEKGLHKEKHSAVVMWWSIPF
jgi:hypothetical protein